MTIDKAIDRNVELKGELLQEGRLEKADAVQLGIEALKETRRNRPLFSFANIHLLPGETA